MNALTTQTKPSNALALRDDELIPVLQSSLYPGASENTIKMILGYCKAASLDPMQKPVHAVPMRVKKPGTRDDYEWRDVVMPGIGLYRTQAVRSGLYMGKSEPEFGPDVTRKLGGVEMTFPQWCRVTVRRLVGGQVADFTARELWLENYATQRNDTDAPNAMWKKRPYGQLAKVAEAQALRQAFPELLGGTNTDDEMAGKTLDDGMPPIDVTPRQPAKTSAAALDAFAGKAPRQAAPAPAPAPAADVIDGETGEVIGGAPALPAEAAQAWEHEHKWMPAWKWISMNLCEMPQETRAPFVADHDPILRAVEGYSDKYRKAVRDLMEQAGVQYGE